MNNLLKYDEVIYTIDGIEYCEHEAALAQLLHDEVCLINADDEKTNIMELFINTSDVFAWGVADADKLNFADICDLYKMHIKDKKWGSVKWACINRNEKPQRPIVNDMKKDGYWDDALESLPDNYYDQRISKLHE